MKIKILVPVLLASMIIGIGYQLSVAKAKDTSASTTNIGVVNLEKVIQQSKRGVAYKEQVRAEQDKVLAELKQLKDKVDADQEGLKALKEGSNDYNERLKEFLNEQGKLESLKQYQKQRFENQDQQWKQKIYSDLLDVVSSVAQSKGLAMVIEKRDLDPSMGIDDLMISTRPILYSGGCVDISDEVLVALNEKK